MKNDFMKEFTDVMNQMIGFWLIAVSLLIALISGIYFNNYVLATLIVVFVASILWKSFR
jgi:hypothetical protein